MMQLITQQDFNTSVDMVFLEESIKFLGKEFEQHLTNDVLKSQFIAIWVHKT
jgi:hypothetical protein